MRPCAPRPCTALRDKWLRLSCGLTQAQCGAATFTQHLPREWAEQAAEALAGA